MTMRSKMNSAISTTDSTEEPNHRLHWLPRLDRRVTICEGKRHVDHRGRGAWGALAEEPRPSLPEALSHSSLPLCGPRGPFCLSHTHLVHPFLPLTRDFIPQPNSPSSNPLPLTLNILSSSTIPQLMSDHTGLPSARILLDWFEQNLLLISDVSFPLTNFSSTDLPSCFLL